MKTNTIHTTPATNVQIQVDELRNSGGIAKYYYYIGWGEYGTLQGDAMTYDELEALHDLMSAVLNEYKTK